MLQRVLTHLRELVSCDTQNPPRAISVEDRVFSYCADILRAAGCAVEIKDLGGGCVSLLARRGAPTVLFNCHLDTVPADPAWTRDPFVLGVNGAEATGLGACDIKGAAAALLAAVEATSGAIAVLLTSDEEAGDSACVRDFIEVEHGYELVIVCEPTNGLAVTMHRGIETFELVFSGLATHSSQPNAHADNALHHAVVWSARAIERMHGEGSDNLRFNIGIVNGGVKTNIAASSATVRFGVRPHAQTSVTEVLKELMGLLDDPSRVELRVCFSAPALDSGSGVGVYMKRFGLQAGEPVDFWTEAALFAAGGYRAMVLGPGDISQAHAPDESVPLADLDRVATLYAGIIENDELRAKNQSAQAAHP